MDRCKGIGTAVDRGSTEYTDTTEDTDSTVAYKGSMVADTGDADTWRVDIPIVDTIPIELLYGQEP